MSKSSTNARRKFLAGAGALGLSAASSGFAPAWAQTGRAPAFVKGATLTVSTWGGVSQDLIKEHAEKEFEKLTGAKIAFDIGPQGPRYSKLLAQRASPPADLFVSNDMQVIAGQRAGVLRPISPKNIANFADLYDWAPVGKGADGTVGGVSFAMAAYVIGYNPDLVKVKPASWADLWRPEFRGNLAFAAPAHSLTPCLVVLAAELAGGNASNVDPGFKKLAELRPNKLTFTWTDWGPLNKSGEVAIATEHDYYMQSMKTLGYRIEYEMPKEKSIASPFCASVVNNSKLVEPAEALIDVLLSPRMQEAAAVHAFLGPTKKGIKLSASTAARCACGAAVDQLRFFDPAFLVEVRAGWTERMNTEVVPQWRTR
jgi:putative spermidine/putrescine transport system substrate-binding protein